MKAAFATVVVALALAWCGVAHAQVYKCTAAGSATTFQDHACARGRHQEIIDVPAHAAAGYLPPAVATAAPPPNADTPSIVAVPPTPPEPLPVLYACVGAVNGKLYLARSPPPPYLAPLGVMGYPPQSYGPSGGAGLSAPELSRPRVGGSPAATGMTEVQDACLPATRAEACRFVRKQRDQNQHRLNLAMPHERPPLERRERQLQDQWRNCR